MSQVSITSTRSFHARLLRSEQGRAWILASVWAFMLLTYVIRRQLHGVVMSVDVLFNALAAVFGLAILYQAFVIYDTRRCIKRGRELPRWRFVVSALVDPAVPIVALTLLQLYSPRGAYAATTGPSLLALPLVIALSALRLQPRLSLLTGLVAAVAHWALAARAIRVDEIEPSYWPLLFTYGALLAVMGVVAAFIASQARATIREAVDEAVAAEQAQRALASVERDLAVARDIQQGLLPTTAPAIAGFDIAGMARPAQETGGDYYDWQPMPDGRLAVALADVTGHGIGPALVMAVCRAYARAAAPLSQDPAGLLALLNTLIYDDLGQTGRFITMVTAIVAPDGRIELVSAGHGPTLLYRAATREVEWFGGDGLPLGIDSEATYGPHVTLNLLPGDALLLLTDGFMEWARRSDGQQFGLERLRATLRDAASGSAKSILDQLDTAVQAFAGGAAQTDDTTAVAIKRS